MLVLPLFSKNSEIYLTIFFLLLLPNRNKCAEYPRIKFSAAKGLICYQCISTHVDGNPLCSLAFFRLTTVIEKLNMTFQCPPNRQDFCFTQEETERGMMKTSRGCHGMKDKHQTDIKVGCSTSEDKTKKLCFCKKHLCNCTAEISTQSYCISLFLFIYLTL